ncbi:MAG: DUF1080 domain-containing protein [Sedimentisphaerales bacterium]|nr:DUF1080 domain-containing protein [Sedimentisphaerales bacterium]
MKSHLLSVLALIVMFVFTSFNLSDSQAATIAQWDFEDGTDGTSFSDMPSGGSVDIENGYIMLGYDTTYGASFSDETPDCSGLSAYCNGGQDGYTTNNTFNSWSPEVWTIEISARLDDISGWETLIGRDGSSYGHNEADFYLQKNNINGAFRLNFLAVDDTRYILDSNFVPASGKWYHLAVTSDGTNLTMYCDKLDEAGYQVVATLTMTGSSPSDNAIVEDNFNWTFGRGWYNGSSVDHISGYFDNVRFSDVVLDPDDFLGYNPVLITESEGKTVLFRGDTVYTDEYYIVLKEEPTDNVTVTVTPPAGLTVGNGNGQSRDVIFTDQNWDQPQTIVVAVADAQATLDDIEYIQHSVQSNDPSYNGVPVCDIAVYIEDDSCGLWGYLEADYNLDCTVDLKDLEIFSNLWLWAEAPLNLLNFNNIATDWLENTFTYDADLYSRSIQESDDPFFINTANVLNTIDEKIYGHFLEHIYHSANGGLWGDLVWNRSFELSGSGGGIWSIDGSDLVQSSMATDVHMEFGNSSWTDYEFTLQAKKDSGNEAFLILFRAADSDNFYWLNIGGWGNTLHAIEKEVNGSRSTVTSQVSGSITTGQWYDIKVRCEDNNIKTWLDEDLLFDYTDSSSPHLAGAVGVGTWSTQARFRNIEVTNLAGTTTLFSGLPTLPPAPFGADFWTLFGSGDATISTDSLNDNYSVQIIGDGSATGLQQDDFKFTQQAYSGSLWMKGTLPAGVSVQLMDGSTVLGQDTLSAPTTSWGEYAFSITPNAETNDGSLRITLLGDGTVLIDQVSMMGQDAINTGGYRPDLLEAVSELRPPVIRWPGGCFASLYLWKDGIGPQHTRRQYPAYMWDDQDTSSYGTDEFLRMCEQIGSEPLICINTGVLDSACGAPAQWKLSPDTTETYVQYALDWMEYCNGDVGTTWGAVRAANGHPQPYNVTFWELDNETWAAGSSAYITAVQQFAPAMQAKAAALGVPIQLSAVGSGGYDQSWNHDIIDDCATLIDYISVHYYEDPGNFKSGPDSYENYIISLAGYIANSANPDMKIYNSEWNAQSTDWRTGLFAGGLLNVYERQGANFKIGGPALFLRHTSAGAWDNAFINFDHTGWFAAPNYVVMRLWHDHYAPNVVETTGTDTNLNVVSTLSDDEKTLCIQIVNPDPEDKSIELEIDDSFIPETAYMDYVAPGDLYAHNTLANPDAVHVQSKVVCMNGQVLRFIMPAYSAGVVTIHTTQPHTTEYLYSFFQGNGDGLHLAYSDDGLTFTALKNNTTFVTPIIGSNLMRDPSICQGPDGMFHMVWTTGWNDNGIGIAHSADLINWSSQTYLPSNLPNVDNCWAPEIFYDDETGKYLIVWSSTINGSPISGHRPYYISTSDFVTYTSTAMFYDPGWSSIDWFIAKDGDRYAMVLKDERSSGKNIRITFSNNAAGPYDVPPSSSITPGGLWVEGPSMIKVGAEWLLYYDAYIEGYMGGQSSTELSSWTDRRNDISFPSGTRHGTVFKVTQEVADALLAL